VRCRLCFVIDGIQLVAQMPAHRGDHGPHLIVGVHVVRRERLPAHLPMEAVDELRSAGTATDGQDVSDPRLDVEMDVKMRHTPDVMSPVSYRVPIEQHPFERDVRAPGHRLRERDDKFERLIAFGRRLNDAIFVAIEQ
jgi:hypothetical protein